MKAVASGARYLLGLILVVFGLNGFLQFIPMPPPTEAMGAYVGALLGTGYFFPVLKITEIVVGGLLLAGLYVPLGLVILAPITIHILLAHVFLDPAGLVMGLLLVALNAFLGYVHRDAYAKLLVAREAA